MHEHYEKDLSESGRSFYVAGEGRSPVAASALCSRSRSARKCTKQPGGFWKRDGSQIGGIHAASFARIGVLPIRPYGKSCFGIFTGSLRDPYPSGTVRTSQTPLLGSCPAPSSDISGVLLYDGSIACDRSRRGAICVSRSVTEPMKQPKQLPAEGRIDMDVDSRKALPWMADAFRPDTV